MGGTWSGVRDSKKPRVEAFFALDTGDLKRRKFLVPVAGERRGSLEWRTGANNEVSAAVDFRLTLGPEGGALRLIYKLVASGETLDYPLPLVPTPCHLGGRRWWFICPLSRGGVACGRRVKKVHLRGKYFGCRHCHDLVYTSSQESDSRVYAALRDGMHMGGYSSIEGMSVAQLGFALKVLTAGQKRLKRLGERLDRTRTRKADE